MRFYYFIVCRHCNVDGYTCNIAVSHLCFFRTYTMTCILVLVDGTRVPYSTWKITSVTGTWAWIVKRPLIITKSFWSSSAMDTLFWLQCISVTWRHLMQHRWTSHKIQQTNKPTSAPWQQRYWIWCTFHPNHSSRELYMKFQRMMIYKMLVTASVGWTLKGQLWYSARTGTARRCGTTSNAWTWRKMMFQTDHGSAQINVRKKRVNDAPSGGKQQPML